jgi:predicted nuclease of predicted toxin-antitoxin system
MAIRFHLDEQIDFAIAVGLRRRGIDVTTTGDANLRSADDIDHIEFALAQGRVIYTNDRDFLRLAAVGTEHCGIVYSRSTTKSIGEVVEFLSLMHSCMTETEMLNRVQFF